MRRPREAGQQDRNSVVPNHIHDPAEMGRSRVQKAADQRSARAFGQSVRCGLHQISLGKLGSEHLLPGLNGFLPALRRVSLVDPFPVAGDHRPEVGILLVGTEERREILARKLRVRHRRSDRIHLQPVVETAHQGLERSRHVGELVVALLEPLDLVAEQGREQNGRTGERLLDVAQILDQARHLAEGVVARIRAFLSFIQSVYSTGTVSSKPPLRLQTSLLPSHSRPTTQGARSILRSPA